MWAALIFCGALQAAADAPKHSFCTDWLCIKNRKSIAVHSCVIVCMKQQWVCPDKGLVSVRSFVNS